jgi:hypothetical protein
MRIVQHVNEDAWRAFVEKTPCGSIFHTPGMMEVFARTDGYQPEVWASLDANDQIAAMFLPVQMTVLDRPFLRRLTTRAVLYGSVLCVPTPEGRAALDLLLRTYNQAMKNQLLFTELRNLADTSELQPVLTANGFVYEEHLNFLIDLTQPQPDIWGAIRSNAKRNVRKARKSGVVIEEVKDEAGVAAAYAVLQQVYKRIQVPLPPRSLFQAAFEVLHPKEMIKFILAKVDGVTIGALTLLIYRGVVTYWYTGTLREFSSYRPSDFLVWHALELGSENGFHTFDFGGGGKPDETYGVRDFKAKFGGNLVNYGRNVRVHAPLRLQASELGYRFLRRFL